MIGTGTAGSLTFICASECIPTESIERLQRLQGRSNYTGLASEPRSISISETCHDCSFLIQRPGGVPADSARTRACIGCGRANNEARTLGVIPSSCGIGGAGFAARGTGVSAQDAVAGKTLDAEGIGVAGGGRVAEDLDLLREGHDAPGVVQAAADALARDAPSPLRQCWR